MATLYGGPLIEGPFNGQLAKGTITAADLAGPLEGTTLSDLAILMCDGLTYVNVHTISNPPGENRGEILSPISGNKAGEHFEITWPRGILQSQDKIGGPWSDVENATSPHAVTPTNGRRFFRVNPE